MTSRSAELAVLVPEEEMPPPGDETVIPLNGSQDCPLGSVYTSCLNPRASKEVWVLTVMPDSDDGQAATAGQQLMWY